MGDSVSGLLDQLVIYTDVLKRKVDDITAHSRDGCYVHGLSLQGARWDMMAGNVSTAKPREMFSPLPVVLLKAVHHKRRDNAATRSCSPQTSKRSNPRRNGYWRVLCFCL